MKKHASQILITPRITEKAALLSESGAYVFMVARDASKLEVLQAVREVFKVTPRKVTLLAVPRKKTLTRGTNRTGQTVGGKKAYVFLKKGDTIELV
jgi:large subunit ribosomal protein L23